MNAHYIKLNELFCRVNWYIFHKVYINLGLAHNDNQLSARWTVRLKYHWIQNRALSRCVLLSFCHYLHIRIKLSNTVENHDWKPGQRDLGLCWAAVEPREPASPMTNLLYLYIRIEIWAFGVPAAQKQPIHFQARNCFIFPLSDFWIGYLQIFMDSIIKIEPISE